MSATPDEFFRSLAHFAPDRRFDHTQTSFSFPLQEGEAVISFKTLPERRVTSLLFLPQLEVTLRFTNVDETAQTQFLEGFDLAFRRGGG